MSTIDNMHREIKPYTYFHSSAADRVRIALNQKGLPFESIPVRLMRNGGAQHSADPPGRARVRALSLSIACEIHPLNHLRVLQYLDHQLKIDESAKAQCYRHYWITFGFTALKPMLECSSEMASFATATAPTMFNCCLISQIANSRRFNTPLDAFPQIRHIETADLALPQFQRASPENQPDAI